MKLAFLLEIEPNNDEIARINETRLKLGEILHDPKDIIENLLCDTLGAKIVKSYSIVVASKVSDESDESRMDI